VKPPAAAAHADVPLRAQRLERPARQLGARGDRREAQQVRGARDGVVVRERRELPQQPLRRGGLVRPGELGDVRPQGTELGDRDLVGGTRNRHRCGHTTRRAGPKPRGGGAVASPAMGDLSSAPVAPVGPSDHVRGPSDAPLVVVYGDYECPFCAALELRLRALPLRVAFRHFPVRASHPRAFPAACAAEAAGRQGAFWPMHDALFADQGRLEDPHLWARARRLGLDLERFDGDRRDPATAARVSADFRAGVRAGVPTTPALFHEGRLHAGRLDAGALERLANLPA
jgi:protein-disulfide isomerase